MATDAGKQVTRSGGARGPAGTATNRATSKMGVKTTTGMRRSSGKMTKTVGSKGAGGGTQSRY